MDMKTSPVITALLAAFVITLAASTLRAGETPKVSDLAGDWQGTNRFTGISYEEATQKKVAPQDVKVELRITPDGKVTGSVGGAELRDCAVGLNRGWLGRLLNIKSDFIIRGSMAGSVAAGSANETNTINVPFNVQGNGMKGSVFVILPHKYPYPILPILNQRLSR